MVLFLAAWAFLSEGTQPEPPGDPDRQVFAVLLPALSRDGAASYIVEVTPLPVPQPSDSDWEWFGSAARPLRAKVEAVKETSAKPFSNVSLPSAVVLVPREELSDLFRYPLDGKGLEEIWLSFRQRFKVQSFYRFSRPVVTEDGLAALVSYSHSCGSLCGESGFVWLRRASRSDRWAVAKLLPKVVS